MLSAKFDVSNYCPPLLCKCCVVYFTPNRQLLHAKLWHIQLGPILITVHLLGVLATVYCKINDCQIGAFIDKLMKFCIFFQLKKAYNTTGSFNGAGEFLLIQWDKIVRSYMSKYRMASTSNVSLGGGLCIYVK